MTLVPQHIILQSPASNDPLLDLNTQPSLDLQFATGKTLDDRVSGLPLVNHQRDASSGKSAGTYVGSDGLIKTSPVNLLTYSSVDQPGWNVAGTSPTVVWNGFSDPNGTNEAAEITFAGATNSQIQQLVPTFTSGVTYTYSLYARVPSGTQDFLLFRFDGGDFSQQFTATASWQRFQWTFVGDGGGAPSVRVRCVSPVGGEVLLVWGAQLEEGSTATTYIPTTSTISGAPRFDHDPVTGKSLGLLIEESKTNQFTNSDLGDSSWTAINITKKSTDNPAPDGTNTAVLIGNATGSANNSYLFDSLDLTGGGVQTFTCYAKGTAAGQSAFIDYYDNGSSRARASISLDDGSVTYVPSPAGDAAITSTDAGNGWWRCQLTLTPTGTIVFEWRVGNNLSGDIYLWGAQVEAGSFRTSYIPTTSSAVTRAADVASIAGTNFSSWYNQSEGTVFVEASAAGAAGIVGFNDGSASERFRVGFAGSNNAAVVVVDGGVVQTNINTSGNSTPYNQYHKLCNAISENNLSLSYNGALLSDNSLSVPSVNKMTIGSAIGITDRVNGHITRLTYYPYRLADATLQEITS
jgi:hypothetical protein